MAITLPYPSVAQRAVSALIARSPKPLQPRVHRVFQRLARVPRRDFTCRTSFGASIRCNPRDFVQQRIMLFGVWEPSVTATIQSLVTSGDVVVDIGAFIGYDSLLLSKLVGPQGRVIAIEPNPLAIERITANLALNGAGNVRLVRKAVAAEPGTLSIFGVFKDNLGSASLVAERGAAKLADVETAPLMSLLRPDEIERVTLIKMDIEGYETEALTQILDNLPAFRALKHVLVEMSSDEGSALFQRFRDAGFNASFVQNDYSLNEYTTRAVASPQPIDALPEGQADVLFSRA